MKAIPGSHDRQPRPVLPTSNTLTDVDAGSTDMTSDDDSSVQSSDSSGTGGGTTEPSAAAVASQLPNGGSFDGAFAAFNIGQH